MNDDRISALVDAVQTNCHVADARHAPDLSLCIYLLQMREFYRWEQGHGFARSLDRTAVGQWLSEREALWSELESREFAPLPFGDLGFDPFDAPGLNAALAPHGLVYGAGLASATRPTFFLAQLDSLQPRGDGLTLQMCGRELARGLLAPPAMLGPGKTIVVRRESLARWLWEKHEAFSLRRFDGPFKALVDTYGLHDVPSFVAALPQLVDDQCETLVLHELGEHRAGQWMDPAWAAMRMTLAQRRTDLLVRAVRDHIADLEVTLPVLLDRDDAPALHFWFANYEGVREQLFPSLGLGYSAWCGGDGGRVLRRAARLGAVHFRALARRVLSLHSSQRDRAEPAIERLLTASESVFAVGV